MKILITLWTIFFSTTAYATQQIPDILIYDGQQLELFSTPLDSLLDDKQVWNVLRNYLHEGQCSADWNGYLGKWKIDKDKLFLVSLHAGACDKRPKAIPLTKLFGRATNIFAIWYSGNLVVPQGKTIPDQYVGYSPRYEKYLIFKVKEGYILNKKLSSKLPFEKP